MLFYQALYLKDLDDFPDQPPTGLIIMGEGHEEYMIWDHRAQGWYYDPEAANYILSSPDHDYRRRPVKRAEAEQIAMVITKGADPLPSEEEILEAFAESHRRREQGLLD
jgi:hypothetical protein